MMTLDGWNDLPVRPERERSVYQRDKHPRRIRKVVTRDVRRDGDKAPPDSISGQKPKVNLTAGQFLLAGAIRDYKRSVPRPVGLGKGTGETKPSRLAATHIYYPSGIFDEVRRNGKVVKI